MDFINGKVVVNTKLNKTVPFYLHNKYIGTSFSNGNLLLYNESGHDDYIKANSFYSNLLIIDDEVHSLSLDTDIKVSQDSKELVTEYIINNYNVFITNVIGESLKSIAFYIEVNGKNEFELNYLFGANVKTSFNPFKSDKELIENGNELNTICMSIKTKSNGNKASFILVVDPENSEMDATTIYNKIKEESDSYKDFLNKACSNNDIKKWALNSSLSLYKNVDGFKCVFAGLDYSNPFRTYYRDSYYTCLSFIKYRSDYVKDEIITLANGIDSSYHAASAISINYKGWWNNHSDSPLFFILLVGAYINYTNDLSILDLKVYSESIKSLIANVLNNLNTDETGLIVKEEIDRRDWADNVYREGYVSYIECLYYGALNIASKYIDKSYIKEKEKVRKSINEILWNQDKNCLYNFKSDRYTEDNVSLDTIFAVIYGVLDENKSIKLLKTFEQYLETKNNKDIKEDFGVMCVYPNYKNKELLTEKSSYPFRYHNGANWPYLSNLYALCKKVYKMDYKYPIDSFVGLSKKNDWTAPFEYYSPFYPVGSMMQGWSSDVTLVYDLDDLDLFI